MQGLAISMEKRKLGDLSGEAIERGADRKNLVTKVSGSGSLNSSGVEWMSPARTVRSGESAGPRPGKTPLMLRY